MVRFLGLFLLFPTRLEDDTIDVQMVVTGVMDILLIGTRIVRNLVGFDFNYTSR